MAINHPWATFSLLQTRWIWAFFLTVAIGSPLAFATESTEGGISMPGAVVLPASGDSTPPGDITWRDNIADMISGLDGQLLAVGPAGLILNLNDGSRRLLPRTAIGSRDFLAAAVAGSGSFWLADRFGHVLLLDDEGHLSDPQETGAEGALFKLLRLTDGTLLGVGEFGSVVSLMPGGRQWQNHELPWGDLLQTLYETEGEVIPHLYGVCQDVNGTVYVTGEFGLVLSWNQQSWQLARQTDGNGNLFACAVSAQHDLIAVGQLGTAVLKIDDTWHSTPVQSGHDLYTVTPTKAGFAAAGNLGQVVAIEPRSSKGFQWYSVPLPTPPPGWLSSILHLNNELLVAGSGGYFNRISTPHKY